MENGKPIIAIVDDEREICSMLTILFQRIDIPVSFIAYDGRDALLKFGCADPKPDIVILDHRLPYIDGVDLMRNMLITQPSTKILFLSSDTNVKNEAYEAGAVLFLVKPASLTTITNAIDILYNNHGKYDYDGYKFVKSKALN